MYLSFSKQKHPHEEFHQCTINNALEQFSNEVEVNGTTYLQLLGINLETIYFAYHLSFLVFVYFLPLSCFIISYVFIIYLMKMYGYNHSNLYPGRILL